MNYLSPSEIANSAVNIGIRKAEMSSAAKFFLGILAGAFIAFGAEAANLITHTMTDTASAKLTAGLIFPAGLITVLMAGAELFTGNCLMIIALAERRITPAKLLSSWLVVYLGNLAGSVILAYMVSASGQTFFVPCVIIAGSFAIERVHQWYEDKRWLNTVYLDDERAILGEDLINLFNISNPEHRQNLVNPKKYNSVTNPKQRKNLIQAK